jgi:hypothetical protein
MREITVRKIIVLENRKCEFCGVEFEPKYQISRYCSKKCIKRASDKRYHDKVQHGGKRHELIRQNGLVCSECGVEGDLFSIVAHHETFNKTDHSQQRLLCRVCHARLHMVERQKSYFDLVCKQCGEKFVYNDERASFCSKKCKRKAEYIRDSDKIKRRVKEWKEANTDRVKKNKSNYYYANHEKCLMQKRMYSLKNRLEREKQLNPIGGGLRPLAGDNLTDR